MAYKKLNIKIINEYKNNERRLLFVYLKINDTITIVYMYAPNDSKRRIIFLQTVHAVIEEKTRVNLF